MYTNLVMKAPRCDGEHFLSLTVSVWCFSSDDYEIESGQGNDTASVQRGRQTEHRPSKVLTTERLVFFSDDKECQVFPLVIKCRVSGVYPCNLYIVYTFTLSPSPTSVGREANINTAYYQNIHNKHDVIV